MPIDKSKFVEGIVDKCMTKAEAYKYAGANGSRGAAQNSSVYARQPDVKRMINEALQDKVLSSLVSLPQLTTEAIDTLGRLIKSKDEKVAHQASKTVLDKARDFLPKEINISHVHEVSENDRINEATSKLEEVAAKILKQRANGEGFAGRLIEAVREDRPIVVQGSDGESGGDDGEAVVTVYSEQETKSGS